MQHNTVQYLPVTAEARTTWSACPSLEVGIFYPQCYKNRNNKLQQIKQKMNKSLCQKDSIYPSIHPSIHQTFYVLSVCLSVFIFCLSAVLYLSRCLLYLSVYLWLSIHDVSLPRFTVCSLFAYYWPNCPSVCLSIHVSFQICQFCCCWSVCLNIYWPASVLSIPLCACLASLKLCLLLVHHCLFF